MSVEFICDGCGKREPGWANRMATGLKPHLWYARSDDDGAQVACSRECIKKIAAETGKTAVVLPI